MIHWERERLNYDERRSWGGCGCFKASSANKNETLKKLLKDTFLFKR